MTVVAVKPICDSASEDGEEDHGQDQQDLQQRLQNEQSSAFNNNRQIITAIEIVAAQSKFAEIVRSDSEQQAGFHCHCHCLRSDIQS